MMREKYLVCDSATKICLNKFEPCDHAKQHLYKDNRCLLGRCLKKKMACKCV